MIKLLLKKKLKLRMKFYEFWVENQDIHIETNSIEDHISLIFNCNQFDNDYHFFKIGFDFKSK